MALRKKTKQKTAKELFMEARQSELKIAEQMTSELNIIEEQIEEIETTQDDMDVVANSEISDAIDKIKNS